MSGRVYRRILLADLPSAEADGWEPEPRGGPFGLDPFSAGTQAAVLVSRPDDDPLPEVRTLLDVSDLGDDELRVLVRLRDRMRIGFERYGRLDIAGSPKDWRAEATEEFLDGAIYLAMQSIRERG